MADKNKDPFADLNIVDESVKVEKPQVRGPITDAERLIMNNIFDTQPKRRMAYAKQIGIELDPEDHNKYKIAGTEGGYDGEIDPGTSIYFKPGGLVQQMKTIYGENLKDLGDLAFDMTIAGASMAAGGKLGAELSANPWISALGGIMGGIAGNHVAELTKDSIGNILLESGNRINPDDSLRFIQDFTVSMAPYILKGGASMTKDALNAAMKMRTNAVKLAIRQAGGLPSKDLLEMAAKKPELFTEQAVQNAEEAMRNSYKNIFGLSEDDLMKRITERDTKWIPDGSIFRPKMDAKASIQKEMYDQLNVIPEGNWEVGEITAPLKAQLEQIKMKLPSERSADEQAAFSYLSQRIDQIYRDAAEVSGQRIDDLIQQVEIPKFKEGNVKTTSDIGLRATSDLSKSGRYTDETLKRFSDMGLRPEAFKVEDGVISKKISDPVTGSFRWERLPNNQVKSLADQMNVTPQEFEKMVSLFENRFSMTETSKGAVRAGTDVYTIIQAADKGKLDKVKFNYSRGRNILDAMQDDAFDREVPGSRFLKRAISANTKGSGLAAVADAKAAKIAEETGLNVDVGPINKEISELRKLYYEAAKTITPQNIDKAFLGGVGNPTYGDVRQVLGKVDKVLGTQLSTDVGMDSMKLWALKQYENPKGMGSGRVLPSAIAGAVKEGTKAAAAGYTLTGGSKDAATVAGILGAGKGFVEGARMAHPEAAMRALNKVMGQQEFVKGAMTPFTQMPGTAIPELAGTTGGLAESLANTLSPGIRSVLQASPQTLEQIYTSPIREQLRQKVTPIPVVNPQSMEPLQIPTNQYVPEKKKQSTPEDPFGDLDF